MRGAFLLGVAAALALAACQPAAQSAATGDVAALTARIQNLEDERAIREAAAAIDHAVDAKDWSAARAAFTDQVAVDFSSLGGGAPGDVSADALVAGWRQNLHRNKPSWHVRGLDIVTLDGDQATLVSHGYAWNALPQRTENDLWEVWGRYEHHFVRTGAGWKVDRFSFTATHERGDSGIRTDVASE
ncbi:MAG: nuclear transport factor 2 family protein [Alphaproteobacteria bacterium]|nr:nuclear transport factor 2 family protein [Alphaproteobacteria bacterium]